METYTVYCHSNNENGKRYVGITMGSVKRRWANGRGYKRNKHFYSSIQKYGWDDGFTHFILADGLSKENAWAMEIEFIAKWKCTNPLYGYNIESGGNTVSESTREKISSARMGHEVSDETRSKISRMNKGKKRSKAVKDAMKARYELPTDVVAKIERTTLGMSPKQLEAEYEFCDEHRRKISEAKMGHIVSEETRAKISKKLKGKSYPKKGKMVAQYTLDGELVRTYKSASEASRETNTNTGSICSVCKGTRNAKTANGYVWRYVKGDFDVIT